MKASDIRNMPVDEIEREISKSREKLFKFRFQASREEMQRAGEIRALRKTIARCMTVLSERRNQSAESSQGATA